MSTDYDLRCNTCGMALVFDDSQRFDDVETAYNKVLDPDRPWQSGVLADLKSVAARKWQGDPAAQRAGLFARAAAEIERLTADNNRIRDWLAGEAECPCCREPVTCADDCTIETDDPDTAARMKWIRLVLAGA